MCMCRDQKKALYPSELELQMFARLVLWVLGPIASPHGWAASTLEYLSSPIDYALVTTEKSRRRGSPGGFPSNCITRLLSWFVVSDQPLIK